MEKLNSIFLDKLNTFNKSEALKKGVNQVNSSYSVYSNQYLKASEEQRKWMDKNSDYILNKIKTLEKKYSY
jgi:tRNA A37 threonylcarbamoyladenosine dehydratase